MYNPKIEAISSPAQPTKLYQRRGRRRTTQFWAEVSLVRFEPRSSFLYYAIGIFKKIMGEIKIFVHCFVSTMSLLARAKRS